jgi:hypothetical protein
MQPFRKTGNGWPVLNVWPNRSKKKKFLKRLARRIPSPLTRP